MRALALVTLLGCLASARADEDDPKLSPAGAVPAAASVAPAPPGTNGAPPAPANGATPAPANRAPSPPEASVPQPLPDEDDPKLARGATVRRRFQLTHAVPRVKLAYRWLQTAGLEGSPIDFHVAELDYYPSSGLFRFGLQAEGGASPSTYGAWFFTVGAAAGLQYPWRVTPYLEARFDAGLIGASFMGQSAVSWIYSGGIEGGVELYVGGRFYLTAALGWAHPVFSGIDVDYVRAHPLLDPERKEFAHDTLTVKVGLGL